MRLKSEEHWNTAEKVVWTKPRNLKLGFAFARWQFSPRYCRGCKSTRFHYSGHYRQSTSHSAGCAAHTDTVQWKVWPLPNVCAQICFSQNTVGKNTLSKCEQTMFEKAGIPQKEQHRHISNHSGKAFCCTTLYNKGFHDHAIKKQSGHRSGALQNYKQTTPRILQEISDSLQPPKPQAFHTNPPAASVKCDTTECHTARLRFSASQNPTVSQSGVRMEAARQYETNASWQIVLSALGSQQQSHWEEAIIAEAQCANCCSTLGIDTISLERNGKRMRITFEFLLCSLTDLSTCWIHVGSQVMGDTWNITTKFWPLPGYIWTTIGQMPM